jgi:thiamine biosynthesis protein ThiS
MTEVTVNNERREVPDTWTLADLVAEYLTQHHMPPEMVNLALNGTTVPRQEWPAHRLKSGDVVEYLWFMGGGAK